MEAVNDINRLLKTFQSGTSLIILNDGIHIKQMPMPEIAADIIKKIIECRFFNESREILIKATSKGLVCRERDDTKLSFEVNTALIRGEFVSQLEWVNGKSIAIKKHDYIDYNELGVASYVDSRFVEFQNI